MLTLIYDFDSKFINTDTRVDLFQHIVRKFEIVHSTDILSKCLLGAIGRQKMLCVIGHPQINKSILDYLLSFKIDIELCDEEGYFMLYMASSAGDVRLVKMLLERGANIDRRWRKDGATSLMVAATNGHMAVVKVLLDNGANLNIKNNNRLPPPQTAYECARNKGHSSIARLIKDYGASTSFFRNLLLG